MKRTMVLAILMLSIDACAPLAPSESKGTDHSCDGPTNNFNSVALNTDAQYDVQTKMGQSPSTQSTNSSSQPVWDYNLCKTFEFTFDLSGHVVYKVIK